MKLSEEYANAVDEQTVPNGKHLDNADYVLIRDGLIATPEQLSRVLARNDNITFAYAAERYANARGWAGFAVDTNELQAREYGARVFDICQRGAAMPNGYFGMYALDGSFMSAVATSSGLDTSFFSEAAEAEAMAEGNESGAE